jgi:hypothetical protein
VAALFAGDGSLAQTGVLDPKGPQRKAIDALSNQIQRAVADQQAARARSGATAASAAAAGAGARGAAAAVAAVALAGQKRGRGGGEGASDGVGAEAAAEEQLLRDLASGEAYRTYHAGGGGAGGGK